MVPTRIKLMYAPDPEIQYMHSGLYFVIPVELSINELQQIESAILTVLTTAPDTPEELPLNVPLGLARKLSGRHRQISAFNTFRFYRNRLYLTGANCFWVPQHLPIFPTDVYNPSYGEVHSLTSSTLMLQCLAALMCLHSGLKLDTRESTAKDMVRKICSQFPNAKHPRLHISNLGSMSLTLGNITFDSFEYGDVNSLYTLMLSFFRICTPVNSFINWK